MIPKVDRIGLVYTSVDPLNASAQIWIPDWEFSHPQDPSISVSFHGGPPPAVPNLIVTASTTQSSKSLMDALRISVTSTGFVLHTDGTGGAGYSIKELEAMAQINKAVMTSITFSGPSPNIAVPKKVDPQAQNSSGVMGSGTPVTGAPRRRFGWPPL